MPSAGSIFVDLLLNDAKFTEGTKRASRGMQGFEKTVTKAAKAAAAAIAAAGAALSALTIRQMHVIDDTGKLARSLGVATENFQAISLVAGEAGVEQERLGTLFTKAQKSIVEAAKGSKSFEQAFARLNLRAAELINLRPDEQFNKILSSLSEIENPTLRNATALEIYGRSGREVVNMLEDYRSKLSEAREFNDKFNISISDIDARKVEEANDTFARLGKAISGLGNTIAIQLSPVITAVSNHLLQAGIDGEDFGRAVEKGMEVAAAGVDVARRAINGLQLTIAAATIAVGDLAANTAMNFYDLGIGISKTLNLIPGVSLEAEDSLLNIALASKKMANDAVDSFNKATGEAKNFKNTIDFINKAQDEADQRARTASGKGGGFGLANIDNEAEMAKVAKTQKELASLYEKNRDLILGVDAATLNYQDTISDLNKLVEAGTITQTQYNDAVKRAQDEFDKASAKANVWAFDMEAAGKRASENIQDALADYLFDPADKGFKGMLKGFVDVMRRMAAEAASAKILKSLFGEGGINFGGIGKSLKNVLPDVSLGSFNLPKFATGIDTVPYDMAAVIHKDEAVLNKAEAASWRSGGNKGGNTYQIDARGADQGAVRRIENALLALAGPGVIEQRVVAAQGRGAL